MCKFIHNQICLLSSDPGVMLWFRAFGAKVRMARHYWMVEAPEIGVPWLVILKWFSLQFLNRSLDGGYEGYKGTTDGGEKYKCN